MVLVEPMAKASVAAGADGLMIEVHNDPECALCDGAQSLKPEKYAALLAQIGQIARLSENRFNLIYGRDILKLTVNLGKNSYPIYIENNILDKASSYISSCFSGKDYDHL